jgi:hypothetical protein
VKAFNLLVYVEALADAYLIAEPYELSLIRFQGDPRISKYLDISATEDPIVLQSSSIIGHQRSTNSSLSSSTTCLVSSRPSSCKFVSDFENSSECSHSSDDSVASILISGHFSDSHLDLLSIL